MPEQTQCQLIFFDPSDDRLYPTFPEPPTDDEIRACLDSDELPLNEVIVSQDNEGCMRTLKRFLFTALSRPNHSCKGLSFGIFAPSGQGKSYIIRQFAASVGIPFVLVQSQQLTDTYALFEQICKVCEQEGVPVVPYKKEGHYRLPPCIVAFDEAHYLKPSLMKGGLLNAMEQEDHTLICAPSKHESITVDCRDVCWIAATTERGALFDAFANRLEPVEWAPAGPNEIKRIVLLKMEQAYKDSDVSLLLSPEAAELVAQYHRVPRVAIKFARKMVQHKKMMGCDWEEAARCVAEDAGLNEFGMSEKEVFALEALGQRAWSKGNLATLVQVRSEELERIILPNLMRADGGPLVVPVAGRGCVITSAGIERLDALGIANRGRKVTAEYIEQRRSA